MDMIVVSSFRVSISIKALASYNLGMMSKMAKYLRGTMNSRRSRLRSKGTRFKP